MKDLFLDKLEELKVKAEELKPTLQLTPVEIMDAENKVLKSIEELETEYRNYIDTVLGK